MDWHTNVTVSPTNALFREGDVLLLSSTTNKRHKNMQYTSLARYASCDLSIGLPQNLEIIGAPISMTKLSSHS